MAEKKEAAVAGMLNAVNTAADDQPAVVVNASASPAALVAWALGQARALRMLVVVGCETADIEHLVDLPEALATLVEQIEVVPDAAHKQLRERASTARLAQGL